MKFSIAKDQFLDGLQQAQHIVSNRATLPILSNVLIEAEKGKLTLSTTDLDVGVLCSVPADVTQPGTSTLPARKLFSIVRELPTSEVTVAVSDDHAATIESGSAFFRILGLDAEEFPRLPQFDKARSFVLPQALLKVAIRKTSYAISTDETRYVLNGVLLSFRNEKMTMVATDGRRLALIEAEVEFPASQEGDVIIPTKAINELERMLGEEGSVELALSGSQARFQVGENVLITKLIEGNYPNFRQVIPSEPRHRVAIDRELLAQTVKRISLLSSDRGQSIRLRFADNELTVSSSAPEVGEAREQIAVPFEGEAIQIAFNPDFVLAPLAKLESDEVSIELIDEMSPGVIKVSAENFLYVIMPMRVSH